MKLLKMFATNDLVFEFYPYNSDNEVVILSLVSQRRRIQTTRKVDSSLLFAPFRMTSLAASQSPLQQCVRPLVALRQQVERAVFVELHRHRAEDA